VIPSAPDALRRMPGVGAYTAGAVASFAYERRAALVDTNVARVLARVFAPELDPKRPRDLTRLWQIAEAVLPRTGPTAWAHNQALMELGATVCTARVAMSRAHPYCRATSRERCAARAGMQPVSRGPRCTIRTRVMVSRSAPAHATYRRTPPRLRCNAWASSPEQGGHPRCCMFRRHRCYPRADLVRERRLSQHARRCTFDVSVGRR
jgi:adenine-specific DNA glycosylase